MLQNIGMVGQQVQYIATSTIFLTGQDVGIHSHFSLDGMSGGSILRLEHHINFLIERKL